jgi:hypothetical protein
MEHRRLIIRRDSVENAVHRIRHVSVTGAIDGDIVGEKLRLRAEHGTEVHHREAFAGRQVVDTELRLTRGIAAERGAVGVRDQQAVTRLVGFDAYGRYEVGVTNERHDTAVALDLEDRAFGE